MTGEPIGASPWRKGHFIAASIALRPGEEPIEGASAGAERTLVHEDIKPNTKSELASFLDVPNMPWKATKFPGIESRMLYADDEGMTTALFKLAAGAVVPLDEHTARKQTYALGGRARRSSASF